jgi:hypothetical protein
MVQWCIHLLVIVSLISCITTKNKLFIAEWSLLATTTIEQRALLINEAGRHPLAAQAHRRDT